MSEHVPRRRSGRALSRALVVFVALRALPATAEGPADGAAPAAEVAEAAERSGDGWSAAAAVNIYVVPEERTYAQPTLAADYKRLHLEARYNYEAFDTGSAWIGFNFAAGEELSFAMTPMIGGVFGNTNGIAPGYELTLAYWKVELYSEGEYLFDTGDSSGDFTYTWSELSLAPVDWARIGMVAQRTRAYETDIDIARGPLVGLSYERFGLTTSVFDLAQSHPIVVIGLTLEF